MSYEWMGTGDWVPATTPLSPAVLPKKATVFLNKTVTYPRLEENRLWYTPKIPAHHKALLKWWGEFTSCLFIINFSEKKRKKEKKALNIAWSRATGSWLESNRTLPGRPYKCEHLGAPDGSLSQQNVPNPLRSKPWPWVDNGIFFFPWSNLDIFIFSNCILLRLWAMIRTGKCWYHFSVLGPDT